MNKSFKVNVPFGQYHKIDRWLRDNVCEDVNVRWNIRLIAPGTTSISFKYELRIHEDYAPHFILTWSEYVTD